MLSKENSGGQHLIIDDVLYYLTNSEIFSVQRLYVPIQYGPGVVKQYHDDKGHLSIDKKFDTIRQMYNWLKLYKELCEYVSIFMTYASTNLKQLKPSVQIAFAPLF